MNRLLPTLLLALAAAGCGTDAETRTATAAEAPTPADSAADREQALADSLAMNEAIREFQAATPDAAPVRLEGGATTLDDLFRELVRAYSRRDAGALDRLAVTRAEFAYLYFPESPYPHPPFQLPPDFVWMLVEERGARAVSRATERLAGEGTAYLGYECPSAVKDEGTNRLWGPCFVDVRLADGREDRLRLANAVVERQGRFKLVGFDNGL